MSPALSDSSDDELIHTLPDVSGDNEHDNDNLIDFQKTPQDSRTTTRPPAIATEWDSMDHGVETIDDLYNNHNDIPNKKNNNHHDNTQPYSESYYPIQSLSHPTPEPMDDESKEKQQDDETTPAFIRQYARDMMKIVDNNLATSPRHTTVVPPASLGVRRHPTQQQQHLQQYSQQQRQEDSFTNADASALDSTFISIRDLNEDDDVPSVNHLLLSTHNNNDDGTFPTERTSLLVGKEMTWRGTFFPKVEKEDFREKKRMVTKERGMLAGMVWGIRSFFQEEKSRGGGGAEWNHVAWDYSHPGGGVVPVRRMEKKPSSSSSRIFIKIWIMIVWFHMTLCALHDVFVRYVSYRNDNDTTEDVSVSWDGEGVYSPPYWVGGEGRMMNPWIGPGSRTLTAFGALVPGLVLSKGKWWRVLTAVGESSSLAELVLHSLVLKSVVGSLFGLESKRGFVAVVFFYVVCAVVGSIWAMAVDPGRIVTSSGLGVTGLLAAAIVEQYWFQSIKEEDGPVESSHNDLGGGHNVVSSTSDEQFSFQQPKKEKGLSIKATNPSVLLLMEILLSWWAPYQSLGGTIAAAATGVSLALIIFVGKSPETSRLDNTDLLFHETPPPPPSSAAPWRDDDDSADSSFGSGRQPFTTPVMRKSIFTDEEEEEPYGPKSMLRKRRSNGSDTKSTPARYISIHPNKPYHTTIPILWRVIGIFMALLLTLIPAILIAASEDPSSETIRASILGCKPMRIVYRPDDNSDVFQCAGGCVPLSRAKVAQKKENMHFGRCDTIGFRCMEGAGTMILRQYELDVGLYGVPMSDGSCASTDDDASGAADANNGEENNVAA